MPILLGLYGRKSTAQEDTSGDVTQQMMKWRDEALAAFPFERLEVSGITALGEWERLKTAKRGAPVVIGGDEDFDSILEPFHSSYWSNTQEPSLAEVLAKADGLTHPDGLLAYIEAKKKALDQWCRDNPDVCTPPDAVREQFREAGVDIDLDYEPPVGEWPRHPPAPTALTIAEDWRTGRPLDSVSIVLIPTDDWTTIPAYLRWGHWNDNPPPEYHVAALRSWRDRYGAELVGLGRDVMNIRVATRPASRDEAMALAREQYAYCYDIVEQDVATLSNLAAALKAHNWWYFWWD